MDVITRNLKGFERRYIRPLVRRLQGQEAQVTRDGWSAECDRLEELAVALVRAELRRHQALPAANSTGLEGSRAAADGEPADELPDLLKSLLDTDLPPTA